MAAIEGKTIDLGSFEIYFLGEKIKVCPLCLNELRFLNSKKFDDELLSKKLS
jgi:hypothetical protein